MHVIPQSWSHLHILISVFPSVGFVFVLGVYIAGLRTGNDFVRRICLAMFCHVGAAVHPDLCQRHRFDGRSVRERQVLQRRDATHIMFGEWRRSPFS